MPPCNRLRYALLLHPMDWGPTRKLLISLRFSGWRMGWLMGTKTAT